MRVLSRDYDLAPLRRALTPAGQPIRPLAQPPPVPLRLQYVANFHDTDYGEACFRHLCRFARRVEPAKRIRTRRGCSSLFSVSTWISSIRDLPLLLWLVT